MMTNADPFISDDILLRKGARKATEIPESIRSLLQSGHIESVNLTEWLAVDHILLFQRIIDELEIEMYTKELLLKINDMNEHRIMKIIPAIANQWLTLFERQLNGCSREDLFQHLAEHRSDSVRCWAAYIIGLDSQLNLSEKLKLIRPFAADHHFGVREIAWMAVREPITTELSAALHELTPWSTDPNPLIRRFAIESTRPHGVWAKHIQALKDDPAIALPMLHHVRSDENKYVQDSVGNWLNDASKTNPEWVRELCTTWILESDTKHTLRITTRAQRSL